MRIDSCRKCGVVLEIKRKCNICKKPLEFSCKKCKFETDEQIHSLCRLADMNHRPMVSEVA